MNRPQIEPSNSNPEPVRTKDIERELGELDAATQENLDLTDQLTGRLQSLIRPRGTTVDKCNESPEVQACQLAISIREQRRNVEIANQTMRGLMEAIEL